MLQIIIYLKSEAITLLKYAFMSYLKVLNKFDEYYIKS